jgi:hypothetical protein
VLGTWTTQQTESGVHTLAFNGQATLMGKTVPVALQFYRSTSQSKTVQGAIGFELHVSNVDKLAPFAFDDFEGPDASTIGKPLLRATINRTGQAALSFSASPSGSYVSQGVFSFEVSELTRKPTSTAKSVLQALAGDTAESLRIVITDPHDAKRTLDLTLPVADKHGDFKALLAK